MYNPCLVIVFNNRFDKNIEKLKMIYLKRFSNIFYLVPGYDGEEQNVIPVYHSSLLFHGFFAEAYHTLRTYKFSHYIFIADDLILNPELNETNIIEKLNLDNQTAFITNMVPLVKQGLKWWGVNMCRAVEALENKWCSDIFNYIMPADRALEKICKTVEYEPLTFRALVKYKISIKGVMTIFYCGAFTFLKKIIKNMFNGKEITSYPLLSGYSDILVLPGGTLKDFCQYCGYFAQKGIYVEVAVPTAIALTNSKIHTIKDNEYRNGDLWGEDIGNLERICDFNMDKLWDTTPRNCLFVHPVKLSRWKVIADD